MALPATIFFEFNLPNGTTWFYFAWLLSMGLFFKFGRVLSFRNWDVLTLFLLVPGFLLLQDARPSAVAIARLVGQAGTPAVLAPACGPGAVGPILAVVNDPLLGSSRWLWLGYLWLLCGSAYFLVRCLIDLALVSRPALSPNLTFGGLAWLALALFICLIAVAYRPERTQGGHVPPPPRALVEKQKQLVGPETMALALAQQPFDFWMTRTFAVLCHLAVVLGLVVMGFRHFQDASAGMAAATFYLMLPYTGMYVGQAHHVWPLALVVWALVVYRWPLLAGMLLGIAAVTAYFPALLLPIWLSFYWKRGLGRFLGGFLLTACLGLVSIGLILWSSGDLARIVREGLALPAWQPWKIPTTEGFWTGVHWAYRIPIFIGYLAFVLLTAFWPSPKNLAQVISLSAAVLIGIQFWYADQGGVYVLWYLPLLVLMVFRPNLSDRRPVPIHPESDWLNRSRRALGRFLARLIKLPEPPLRTS